MSFEGDQRELRFAIASRGAITFRWHEDYLQPCQRGAFGCSGLSWGAIGGATYVAIEVKKRFGPCVLDYIVTSNHVHLLIKDTGSNVIAESMQLIGRFSRLAPTILNLVQMVQLACPELRPGVQPLRFGQAVKD